MPMPAFNDYPNDYLESHKIKKVQNECLSQTIINLPTPHHHKRGNKLMLPPPPKKKSEGPCATWLT